MNPFRQKVDELVNKAKQLHDHERETSLESVEVVGELLRRNASGYLLISTEDLARRIGLTPNQFWKRAQAARVLERFPAFREQVAQGDTSVTSLAFVAPRITDANSLIFLKEVRGKSSRQVRELVGKVDFAGNSLPTGARRKLDNSLNRALDVAASRGRCLTRDALLSEALGMWLDEWEDVPSSKKEA